MPRRKQKKRRERRKISLKRRACRFCVDKELPIDFKLSRQLSYFLTEQGKLVPRRVNGNCSFHQRRVVEAVKRARVLALLPYTFDQTSG